MTTNASRDLNGSAVRRLLARHGPTRLPREPWTNPTPRLPDGTLPTDVHLTHQWCLGQEMDHKIDLKMDHKIDHKMDHKIDHKMDHKIDHKMDHKMGPWRSCLAMGQCIQRHAAALGAEERRRLQGPTTAHEAAKAQRAAEARQDAVLRYEMSIPRRRAAGHYSHLTTAQVGLGAGVPNVYTADRLVERNRGRWVLQNPHRQQLLRGEPVMTRIMKGEFYEGPRERKQEVKYVRENKRHVAVASAINQKRNI